MTLQWLNITVKFTNFGAFEQNSISKYNLHGLLNILQTTSAILPDEMKRKQIGSQLFTRL